MVNCSIWMEKAHVSSMWPLTKSNLSVKTNKIGLRILLSLSFVAFFSKFPLFTSIPIHNQYSGGFRFVIEATQCGENVGSEERIQRPSTANYNKISRFLICWINS